MEVLVLRGCVRNSVFRGVLKKYPAFCVEGASGSQCQFHFRLNRWKGTLQSSRASVFESSQLCRWYQHHLRRGPVLFSSYLFPATNNDRHYSTKPVRDVKPDNIQADDVPGAVSHIPSELCLVSGKSAKICSCSCCAEERARKNIIVSKTAGEESKLNSVEELPVSPNSVADDIKKTEGETPAATSEVKKPGLLRRFHMMYKQYGLVMVCVHWSLASVWTGIFYYAAISGVDVVPLLKWFGASDKIIAPFLRPAVGHAAVTYLLYKLFTPLRYTVTLAATQVTVKYLRQWGYMKTPENDSLRALVNDGRSKVKDKVEEVRDKVEVVRDKVEDRLDDIREDVRDKIDEVRDKMEDKFDNLRDDVQELKGKFSLQCHKEQEKLKAAKPPSKD